MSNVKERLLRREAKRILGERTASVVGELREKLLASDSMVSDLANLLMRQSQTVGTHDGRLGALEYVEDELRRSLWTRLKWLWTGRVTR